MFNSSKHGNMLRKIKKSMVNQIKILSSQFFSNLNNCSNKKK